MGHAEVMWSAFGSVAPHSQFDEGAKTPCVHGLIKTPYASPKIIEFNSRCSGQAYSKGPSNGVNFELARFG